MKNSVLNIKSDSVRLVSIDALRGFDMFWIIGGAMVFKKWELITSSPLVHALAGQMKHRAWNGFSFYDMVFPLFLFLAGVSFPFSLDKRESRGDSKWKIYVHIIRRMLILILLGMIYNGLLQFNFSDMRYVSVLSRIGLAWGLGAIIAMNTTWKGQTIWCLSLLLGYWAAMTLIPVPGFGAGVLTMGGSFAAYVDRCLVPGKLYLDVHDPEGLFATIPAVSTALLGILTGQLLQSEKRALTPLRKGLCLLAMGVLGLFLGMLWNLAFPINKNLWTSSFVLFAGGFSAILLSVFYLMIDVGPFKKLFFPFVVIGMNSITIYMLQDGILPFLSTTQFFFGGLLDLFPLAAQAVLMVLCSIVVKWVFLYILYKYRIFLRVG
ncbi:MAG: acyltransferase family protein [Kiritimatiellales bacterium]